MMRNSVENRMINRLDYCREHGMTSVINVVKPREVYIPKVKPVVDRKASIAQRFDTAIRREMDKLNPKKQPLFNWRQRQMVGF
jgi:hypothetical protein